MTFFEWPVWDFIADCAQVVGLVAIVIAVIELVARRNRMPEVLLNVSRQGWIGHNDAWTRAFRISNTGPGGGQILFYTYVKATLPPATVEPLRFAITPGLEWTIEVDSEDIEDAWLLIAWRRTDSARTCRFQWFPLGNGSAVPWSERTDQIVSASTASVLLQAALRQLPVIGRRIRSVPVGPGAAISTSIKLPTTDEFDRITRLALDAGGSTYTGVLNDMPHP